MSIYLGSVIFWKIWNLAVIQESRWYDPHLNDEEIQIQRTSFLSGKLINANTKFNLTIFVNIFIVQQSHCLLWAPSARYLESVEVRAVVTPHLMGFAVYWDDLVPKICCPFSLLNVLNLAQVHIPSTHSLWATNYISVHITTTIFPSMYFLHHMPCLTNKKAKACLQTILSCALGQVYVEPIYLKI